jgi:2-C-methyl-D-erythritol 4-phosphate cytidylyltransferase
LTIHALIPAAGSGTRLGADRPKQYLTLGHQSMLEHAIDALLGDARISQVLVVLSPADALGAHLPGVKGRQRVAVARVGGASRAASVRAGLQELNAQDDDWVLVHDAARPALTSQELAGLIDALADDAVGGLLALPVADTLKRTDAADAPRVAATVDRAGLWRALTPQMFRVGLLRRALDAGDLGAVTDEASAVERLGLAPRLVGGRATNIKVTTADDVPLACAILVAQGRLGPTAEATDGEGR